jgi:hypothetical protein
MYAVTGWSEGPLCPMAARGVVGAQQGGVPTPQEDRSTAGSSYFSSRVAVCSSSVPPTI